VDAHRSRPKQRSAGCATGKGKRNRDGEATTGSDGSTDGSDGSADTAPEDIFNNAAEADPVEDDDSY
jgi:hypothetical protein